MRIYERLRERQSPGFVELGEDADIAPVGTNTVHANAASFQPAEATYRGHSAETPQTTTGHA